MFLEYERNHCKYMRNSKLYIIIHIKSQVIKRKPYSRVSDPDRIRKKIADIAPGQKGKERKGNE